jgi:hypothetical protein
VGSPRLFGLAAVTLVTGIVVACGDGYGEGEASRSEEGGVPAQDAGDVDVDVAGDAIAPSLNCPLGCLPPAPAGWTGPSAVYEGTVTEKPAACPPVYTQKERDANDGVTPGAASCACGSGTVQGLKCTVVMSSYSALKCGGTKTDATIDTSVIKCVDRPAASFGFEIATPVLSAGSCSYPNAKITSAAPTFARAAVACGLPQYASCSERADCVASPIPAAPFTRLCIHKAGDQPCPSADYAARFTVFEGVADARACTCSAVPYGASCGSLLDFYSGAGCTGSPNSSNTGVCATNALSADISGLAAFSKGCDGAKVQSSVTGGVSLVDPVTFCCNK